MVKMPKIAVLPFGLGPIGIEIVKKSSYDEAFDVIGGVDIDPNKVDQPLEAFVANVPSDTYVRDHISKLTNISNLYADKLAVHATGSYLPAVWPQIKQLLDHGYHVVTTCEEMLYPWHRYPELSEEIDTYAKEKGRAVIGTGINPGFVMDTLPLLASTVTDQVTKVHVTRQVDAKERRVPLQKKVGIGKTVEEFVQLAEENAIGHVGLEESLRMLTAGLGLTVDSIDLSLKPVILAEPLSLSWIELMNGDVAGQHQLARAVTTEGVVIELELTMAAGTKSKDEVWIEGSDNVHLVIPGGVFGDTATASMIINVGKQMVSQKQSGLVTMLSGGVPRYSLRK